MFLHVTDYFAFDNPFTHFLEDVFSTLTSLKFEISFLLSLPLSSGITDAVLAFSGKTFYLILVLMTFVSNGFKKFTKSFTSLGGIASMSPVFLDLDFSGF